MEPDVITKQNIKQAVPFFMIHDMERSLKFYVDGLGFEMKNRWTPRGTIEWCWLQREGAAIMLQEYRKDNHPTKNIQGKLGEGVSIGFPCESSLELYHEFSSKGLHPEEPFVGNNMWDVKINHPDGYILHFESRLMFLKKPCTPIGKNKNNARRNHSTHFRYFFVDCGL